MGKVDFQWSRWRPLVVRLAHGTMKRQDVIPQVLEKPPMGQTVSLDLPPDLAQRAAAVAQQTHRHVEDVLLEWLGRAASDVPVEALPDKQILALADREMSQSEQREISALLARQREEALDDEARAQLDELMTSYRRGMVEKARALKEAVERGLRPPLDAHA